MYKILEDPHRPAVDEDRDIPLSATECRCKCSCNDLLVNGEQHPLAAAEYGGNQSGTYFSAHFDIQGRRV
jgi:hypothetical protein